jgi:hypothetical protein
MPVIDTYPIARYNVRKGTECFMRIKEAGDLIGPVQAALILGIGRSTLWRGSNDGWIPVYTWVPQLAKPDCEPTYRAIYSRTALQALKARWESEGRDQRMKHKRPRGCTPPQ